MRFDFIEYIAGFLISMIRKLLYIVGFMKGEQSYAPDVFDVL